MTDLLGCMVTMQKTSLTPPAPAACRRSCRMMHTFSGSQWRVMLHATMLPRDVGCVTGSGQSAFTGSACEPPVCVYQLR